MTSVSNVAGCPFVLVVRAQCLVYSQHGWEGVRMALYEFIQMEIVSSVSSQLHSPTPFFICNVMGVHCNSITNIHQLTIFKLKKEKVPNELWEVTTLCKWCQNLHLWLRNTYKIAKPSPFTCKNTVSFHFPLNFGKLWFQKMHSAGRDYV